MGWWLGVGLFGSDVLDDVVDDEEEVGLGIGVELGDGGGAEAFAANANFSQKGGSHDLEHKVEGRGRHRRYLGLGGNAWSDQPRRRRPRNHHPTGGLDGGGVLLGGGGAEAHHGEWCSKAKPRRDTVVRGRPRGGWPSN